MTEIGKRTLEMGVTIAPHPHIWGPIERPEEVRAQALETPRAAQGHMLDIAAGGAGAR